MYCLSIYHLFIHLYLYLLASLLIFQLSTLPYYPLFEGLFCITGTGNLIFQNPLPHIVSGQSLPRRSCTVFGKWTGEEVFIPGRLWQPNTMASRISSQGPPWLLQTKTKPWDSNRWNFLANLRDRETCLFQCFRLKSSVTSWPPTAALPSPSFFNIHISSISLKKTPQLYNNNRLIPFYWPKQDKNVQKLEN